MLNLLQMLTAGFHQDTLQGECHKPQRQRHGQQRRRAAPAMSLICAVNCGEDSGADVNCPLTRRQTDRQQAPSNRKGLVALLA